MRLFRVTCLLALGMATRSLAPAQEKPHYMRIQCVKVNDGKFADFTAMLPDNRKLAKLRVESGRAEFSVVGRAVYPAGRSATCDYHFVDGYEGFPPEALSTEQSQAEFKKAGLNMTLEDYRAKLNSVGFLVEQELWLSRAAVGNVSKDGYVRINYNKVKPGMGADYLKWETNGWKQLAEAAAKDKPGISWGLYTLSMPSGSGRPYNAMTVDGFPTWDALGKGLPIRDLWSKVHPDVDYTQHMQRMTTMIDRPSIEVFKVIDVIRR